VTVFFVILANESGALATGRVEVPEGMDEGEFIAQAVLKLVREAGSLRPGDSIRVVAACE
jgi:hypothetical protein